MACKRPSASVVDDALDPLVYVTPRTECHCGSSLQTIGNRVYKATLVTLTGCTEIKHMHKLCTRRGYRALFQYNYAKRDGKRMNSVSLKDVTARLSTPSWPSTSSSWNTMGRCISVVSSASALSRGSSRASSPATTTPLMTRSGA